MLINELPDDCLLTIFDYLNNLDDLINCYKVKYKDIVALVRNQESLEGLTGAYASPLFNHPEMVSFDLCIYPFKPLKLISYDIRKKLYCHKFNLQLEYKDIAALVRNQESLEGLIAWSPFKHPDKPEMTSFDLFEPSMQHIGSSIKQLCGVYDLASFQKYAHYFPNLERLKIISESQYYDGPVLEKLKIIELGLRSCGGLFIVHSFQVMDSCPNLQSAHIDVNDRFFVDETIKLQYLQDLVISTYNDCENSWNDFERLLKKYPNLKHLALRNLWQITDEHIEQLVHILPNLLLLDVRYCYGVTQRAADYVQSHCKRYGRSIKFYFKDNTQIQSDWPQLSTKFERISRGFDFMKHCFLKDFLRLPHLLIPIDY
uniref:F-box domain-containing protein n=1 Tax=Tetranychus urticae TaxID=32264 RepID=T1K8V1_TETUR